METHEEGLLVERERQERERHRVSGDSDDASCKHHDGAADHMNVETVR